MVATESEVSGSVKSLNARANALLMHSMGLKNTGPAETDVRRQVRKRKIVDLKENYQRTSSPCKSCANPVVKSHHFPSSSMHGRRVSKGPAAAKAGKS